MVYICGGVPVVVFIFHPMILGHSASVTLECLLSLVELTIVVAIA